MLAAIDADQQRAELAIRLLITADHHFMARPAFRSRPSVGLAGSVRRIRLLGDDAFQRQLAGGPQHDVAAAPYEHEAAMQALAVEDEFEIPFFRASSGDVMPSGSQ